MIKNLIIYLVFTLFIGCSHGPQTSSPGTIEKQTTLGRPMGSTRLLIHLVRPENLELILIRVGHKKEEKFAINTILSQLEMSPGQWQLQGLVIQGRVYRFENADQMPIFKIQKNKVSYIGTYLFQCPKVSDSHRRVLKEMSYFNRYKLNSSGNLCELVVGSDFDRIKKVWKKIGDKQLPLALGI